MSDNLWSFLSAWLVFVVMNRVSLHTIVKKKAQRTGTEQTAIERGLAREVAFEFFVSVPTSAALVLLLRPFLFQYSTALADMAKGTSEDKIAIYAFLGMVSYGFPFTALRDRFAQGLQAVFSAQHPTPHDGQKPSKKLDQLGENSAVLPAVEEKE